MERSIWLYLAVPVVGVIIVAVLLPMTETDLSQTREVVPTAVSTIQPTILFPDDSVFAASADFAPLPEPGPMDWLSVHPEAAQSFESFVNSRRLDSRGSPTSIELVPMTVSGSWVGPHRDALQRFTAAFFVCPVSVADPVFVDLEKVRHRLLEGVGPPARQLLTGDLLDILRRRRQQHQQSERFIVGMVTDDLYPGEEWNFVFGQASLSDRVAVYSFARYDPAFWGEVVNDSEALVLRRSLKVLAHETAHMFGIRHCTRYRCILNGANHLREADATPFYLCPVDLAKLHHVMGFDPIERYIALAEVYGDLGMTRESRWINDRLQKIAPSGTVQRLGQFQNQ